MHFLQQINVKNVDPDYGTGIRSHLLQNMSLIPEPLDQGSRAGKIVFYSIVPRRTGQDECFGVQCDQMTNVPFKLWPFTTMAICPVA